MWTAAIIWHTKQQIMNNSSPTNFSKKLLTVQVEKLRLRAYIGFQKWEREKLQDVIITFSFKYNGALASKKDDVEHAVNYKPLTKQIIKLIDRQSFDLIEAMAETIYDCIRNFHSEIQDIEVCLEKPHALRFADNVLIRISEKDRPNQAIISLGSNINPEENFEKALTHLTHLGIIINRTEFIKTKPLKFENQNDFLNGAVLIQTTLSKDVLRLKLKQIEALLGRVRSENKNAPREIDLDVLSYNRQLIDPSDLDELPFLKDFLNYLRPDLL